MSMRLHLLRHGQTDFSRENLFCGSGVDPDLTDSGAAMARAFAGAHSGDTWAAIFSSPLKRTMQTAAPIAEVTGLPIQVRPGLTEIAYGRWEGLTVEAVSRDFHDDYIRWTADPAWSPPTGGEQAITIAHRALSVVEEVSQLVQTGSVLLVSHKATIRILLCSLLGVDVGRFRYRFGCPVGSVSEVEFTDHGPLLHCLADRSHLDPQLRSLPGT